MAMPAARHDSGPRPTHAALVSAQELTRRQIVRALQARKRYRYVKPAVSCIAGGWLITSPCCSRNVDPEGGVIDIALLTHDGERWYLHVRSGDRSAWTLHNESPRLHPLLAILCEDEEREFWP